MYPFVCSSDRACTVHLICKFIHQQFSYPHLGQLWCFVPKGRRLGTRGLEVFVVHIFLGPVHARYKCLRSVQNKWQTSEHNSAERWAGSFVQDTWGIWSCGLSSFFFYLLTMENRQPTERETSNMYMKYNRAIRNLWNRKRRKKMWKSLAKGLEVTIGIISEHVTSWNIASSFPARALSGFLLCIAHVCLSWLLSLHFINV